MALLSLDAPWTGSWQVLKRGALVVAFADLIFTEPDICLAFCNSVV